jgi:hypothetical protein
LAVGALEVDDVTADEEHGGEGEEHDQEGDVGGDGEELGALEEEAGEVFAGVEAAVEQSECGEAD